MTAHSPLGPSSAHRWMNCPGSVLATKDIKDKATAYSVEGNAAHTLTEWCRLKDRAPTEYLGETIMVERDGQKYGVVVDQDMVDAAQTFVEYVDALPGTMLVEERVGYSQWVPEGFGTLDDARLLTGLAYITDFKYGQGVKVDATDNEQLKLYALGILQEYDWLYNFADFALAVVQPRLDHISEWRITREEVIAWANTVVEPAAKLALTEGAPFKAGEWCRFCRIKETCRVRAEAVFETVVGEFDNIEAASCQKPRASLTNDEVAAVLRAIPQIESWVKDIEAHAMAELAHGRAVGDWKMVEGRGGREWGVEEDALKTLWTDGGLDPLDLHEIKLVSVAKAEKIAGKKHPMWARAGLVNKVKGKPTLAPGTDKRPALTVDAMTEFEKLEEGTAE